MNKIGIYYAYWTKNWDADFHIYIDKVADLGFDILEINAGTIVSMSSAERKSLTDHAASKGITLTHCIGLPAQYDVASPNETIRKNGVKYLQQMAQAVGEMGGGIVGGIVYSSWPFIIPEGGLDKNAYVERSIKSMKEVVKTAEDNNVIFTCEIVNRFEQFLLNTAAEGVAYAKQVDSPSLKIMLDTFHMNIEESSIAEAVATGGEYIGHVHIGENNRMPPGYGHIPWNELVVSLKKINYQKAIVMEPFLKPGGEVGRDIRVWRDLGVGMDMDEEARKAVNFMRTKLLEVVN